MIETVFFVISEVAHLPSFLFDDAKLRPFRSVTNKNKEKCEKMAVLLTQVKDCVRAHFKKAIFLCAHTVLGGVSFLPQNLVLYNILIIFALENLLYIYV